jgi:hypothetical protein
MQDNIMGVTGVQAKAMTIIDIPCEVERKGKKEKILLKDVTYVPESQNNLFSLTKLITNGWTMSGRAGEDIKMSKGVHELNFDKAIHTPKGVLYVVVLKRRMVEESCAKDCTQEESNVVAIDNEEGEMVKEVESVGNLQKRVRFAICMGKS